MYQEERPRPAPAARRARSRPSPPPTWTRSRRPSTRLRGRQAGRPARAVPAELPRTATMPASTWRGCCRRSRTTRVAVELRHRSWSDHSARRCCAAAGTPAPRGRRSTSRSSASRSGRTSCRTCAASTTCACTAGTRRSGGRTIIPDERYDYLYSPAEVDGFADTVNAVRELVQKIYVFMNNHFAGKAVANAAALRHALGQPVPGEYSDEMLARYPFLQGSRRGPAAARCSTDRSVRRIQPGKDSHRRGRRAAGRLMARIAVGRGGMRWCETVPCSPSAGSARPANWLRYYFTYIRLMSIAHFDLCRRRPSPT